MFGLFDYSDPTKVNIKVSVWGYVKFPGKYIIPVNSTLRDLLSYAGGPTADAYLDDVRLVRTLPDSTQQVFTYNFSELTLEPAITKKVPNQTIQPGDMLLLPGQPRMYFKDYFTMFISTVSALSSLTILIINLAKK
jgi:protein involved in polysaccharide export with SLBB domain